MVKIPRTVKRLKPAYRVAMRLRAARDTINRPGGEVSHLWLCQTIAADLRAAGLSFTGYRFSQLCGYDYNITR